MRCRARLPLFLLAAPIQPPFARSSWPCAIKPSAGTMMRAGLPTVTATAVVMTKIMSTMRTVLRPSWTRAIAAPHARRSCLAL